MTSFQSLSQTTINFVHKTRDHLHTYSANVAKRFLKISIVSLEPPQMTHGANLSSIVTLAAKNKVDVTKKVPGKATEAEKFVETLQQV